MRLIDADALADALFEKRKNYPQWVADTIGAMPDAIVRCKDCKHRFNGEHHDNCCDVLMEKVKWTFEVTVDPEWFCADRERKDNGRSDG